MARLNIEDSIFRDTRFIDYVIATGDREKAIGRLVTFWMVAQSNFLEFGEIPNETWVKANLDENLVKFGLAERSLTGVRARGQNEQFAWLKQVQQAGRSSAIKREAKKSKKGSTDVEKKVNDRSTNVDGSPTSYSSSLSYSFSNSYSELQKIEKKPSANKNEFCSQAIRIFCSLWKEKYSATYEFLPKEKGLLKQQFSEMSIEKFEELVRAFLSMHKGKFVEKRHSFTELYFSLQEVNHYKQTGKKVSRHDVNQIELQEHNQNIWTQVAKEMKK